MRLRLCASPRFVESLRLQHPLGYQRTVRSARSALDARHTTPSPHSLSFYAFATWAEKDVAHIAALARTLAVKAGRHRLGVGEESRETPAGVKHGSHFNAL